MKKKLTRIWGVGLVVVMISTLLLSAAPVSASELGWGTTTIPSATNNVIVNGLKIVDMTVADDGTTVYAADGANAVVYKSTDAGRTWGTKTTTLIPTLVAVAPDDASLLMVATAAGAIEVSTNGGTSFTSLGTSTDAAGAAIAVANDIAISPADGDNHYLTVAGNESATVANVWYYKLGSTGAAWKELNTKNGFGVATTGAPTPDEDAVALGFSPNFASDKVLLVVTLDVDTGTDVVQLEVYSFNTSAWNQAAAFTSYPAAVVTDATGGTTVATTASLAVSPLYLGSDDAERLAFVGVDSDLAAGTDDGIYRMKDTTSKALKVSVDVNSIAYDGSNLVAGQVSANAVWRCSDPLASSPTVSSASSLKRLLGTNVIVAWAGADVMAATQGVFSAFGISRDNGKSFNGISFVDYGVAGLQILDVAISADGGTTYMATNGTPAAYGVWRQASDWEMVFNSATAPTMPLVRLAPDDPTKVYIAQDQGASQTIYYSAEGGDTKWFMRSAKANVSDLTVEDSDTLYSSNGANVYRSTNNGFTWGSSKSAGIGTVWMIKSIGADTLVAGSTSGRVSTSTDGAQTWSKPHSTEYPFTGGNAFVAATGASDGDFIYVANSAVAQNVVRWEIGSSTSWKDIISGTTGGTEVGTGIELSPDGVLYVLVNDPGVQTGFYRTLSPSSASSSTTWSTAYKATTVAFTLGPDALSMSPGNNKLWAVDTANNALYQYEDTLASMGPTLGGPSDGTVIQVNPVSGGTFTVPFSWERPSKGTIYNLVVALDSGFNEKVINLTGGTALASTSSTVSSVQGGGLLMPDTTYYWRARAAVNGPIYSPWSAVRSFTIGALPDVAAPVVIPPAAPAPAPEVVVEAPIITIQPPEIVIPPSPAPAPAPEIVIPAAPAAPAPITPGFIWAIVIIGAILIIALIILIIRTRRPV